jgi:hypothetical protein
MSLVEEEITLQQAIQSLREKLFDLQLQGTDGALVPANRNMLAARSPVFYGMLYGDFVEAKRSIVKVGYPGDVLEAIVAYIYTNDAPILNHQEQSYNDNFCWAIASLIDAATYFELPKLGQKAKAVAYAALMKVPSLSVVWLAASDTFAALTADMEELALTQVRSNPDMLLEGESISLLGVSRMESILKDKKMDADEFTLFRILQAWADVDDSRKHAAGPATQLAKFISLELIDPAKLSTTVALSGLTTKDQLCDAFATQALTLSQKHSITYKKRRLQPVWKGSNSSTLRFAPNHFWTSTSLECPALTSGVHKWSILVEELAWGASLFLYLGVASTVYRLKSDDFLGNQSGGWAYGSTGEAYHSRVDGQGRDESRSFVQGSTVRFILDLTGEGTLGASVDGKPVVKLFSSLWSKFVFNRGKAGFVPAISMYTEGETARVKFLGFE